MILLKDLSNLFDLEFCYQWSNQDQRGNNGILGLKKQSHLCITIMNKYIEELEVNNTPLNTRLNKKIFDIQNYITCLPSALFDPVWLCFDKKITSKYCDLVNFDKFFQSTKNNITIENFFGGFIYAYHWHSRNTIKIKKNSYYERLENDINKKYEVLNNDS